MSDARYVDRLSAEQVRDAQQSSHELWGGEQTLEARVARLTRYMHDFPECPLWMSGMVADDGAVVSSLKRYHLALERGEQVVPAVGLGAVFTAPEARGRRLAPQLIEHVLESERSAGTQAALLYSGIGRAYYERLGFSLVQSERWSIDVERLPQAEPLAVRRAEAEDVPLLCELSAGAVPRDAWSPATTPERWRFIRALHDVSDEVLSDGGECIGYVACSASRERLFLVDYAIDPGAAERVWATLRQMAAERGCSVLAGWVSRAPLPAGSVLQPRESSLAMLRPLEPSLGSFEGAAVHLRPVDYF